MGNLQCCACLDGKEQGGSGQYDKRDTPIPKLIPFDANTEIWMKEFTKKLVQDIINTGVPVDAPRNEALMDTINREVQMESMQIQENIAMRENLKRERQEESISIEENQATHQKIAKERYDESIFIDNSTKINYSSKMFYTKEQTITSDPDLFDYDQEIILPQILDKTYRSKLYGREFIEKQLIYQSLSQQVIECHYEMVKKFQPVFVNKNQIQPKISATKNKKSKSDISQIQQIREIQKQIKNNEKKIVEIPTLTNHSAKIFKQNEDLVMCYPTLTAPLTSIKKESEIYQEIQINHSSISESINYEKSFSFKQDFWSNFQPKNPLPVITFHQDFIFISDKNQRGFIDTIQNLCYLIPPDMEIKNVYRNPIKIKDAEIIIDFQKRKSNKKWITLPIKVDIDRIQNIQTIIDQELLEFDGVFYQIVGGVHLNWDSDEIFVIIKVSDQPSKKQYFCKFINEFEIMTFVSNKLQQMEQTFLQPKSETNFTDVLKEFYTSLICQDPSDPMPEYYKIVAVVELIEQRNMQILILDASNFDLQLFMNCPHDAIKDIYLQKNDLGFDDSLPKVKLYDAVRQSMPTGFLKQDSDDSFEKFDNFEEECLPVDRSAPEIKSLDMKFLKMAGSGFNSFRGDSQEDDGEVNIMESITFRDAKKPENSGTKSWITQNDPLALAQVLRESLQKVGEFSIFITLTIPSSLTKKIMVAQAQKIAEMTKKSYKIDDALLKKMMIIQGEDRYKSYLASFDMAIYNRASDLTAEECAGKKQYSFGLYLV